MFRLYLTFGCLLLHANVSLSNEKECDAASHSSDAAVISKGKQVLVEGQDSPFERKLWGNDNDEAYYVLNEEKRVFYVPNFLNASTCDELQSFCSGRFVRSPVRGNEEEGRVKQDSEQRTSESCALLPAALYLSNPRFDDLKQKENPTQQEQHIFRMVDVLWQVSKHAANLLDHDPTTVEPLQLVRYTSPDAYYREHHDHGGYYGKTTEHRPWTVLVFLTDVPSGGHTWFPKLDLKVIPRAGDAIAWSNVDANGKVDGDVVHAGQPPGEEGIEKVAVNIWLGEEPMDGTNPALAGDQWGDNK